ncbi:hypothetical protein ACJIZ3_003885 [Penstemon smallii]|uniref:Uncharacterized protein n=1 Tax=Penstemon smallii TaxID=265156 RepID=A0ABD3S0H4_9LAMI
MLQIEAIQTVMPTKSTDPKTSSNIKVVPQDLNNSTIFLQRRFNIVLCYKKSCDEDSGWIVAGWIKESLGRALAEQPVFAGRVRRQSEESGDLFVVSDDSGVRLVEGKAEMKLDDFLNLKSKGQIETELVFWEDVFQLNPRFSPLFYVQVTNFSCGGYSIGISCSLLLADPFVLTTFLNNWSNLHNEIVSKPNLPKIPLFYLPNLAKPGSSSPYSQTTPKSAAAQSIIFTIPTNILNSDNNIINYTYNDIVALCIDKAEHEVGTKMASKFSLLVKLPPEDFKVEIMSREKLSSSIIDNVDGLSCGKIWDEVIKVDEICFGLGNKPEYASCWINNSIVLDDGDDEEGFVMIIASDDLNTLGMKIVVTFP